jgi:myo-inositol-1(or 4)-monophosphatase
MISTTLLGEYLEAAMTAAQHGARALQEWQSRFNVRFKGRADLVTEADEASQQAVRSYLLKHFPDHAFLGEEGEDKKLRPKPGAPPTWIVDPLDGTTNFVHGFPMYCVSIGLEISGKLEVGVVLDPIRQEMFHAATGVGAWVGAKRLSTSRVNSLNAALLTTGFPADTRNQGRLFTYWRHLSEHAQGLRRTGSTALNLAYLAAGRCDGYWGFDSKVWDTAGAVVILREAGGNITKLDGSPYDPYISDAVASNGPLHPALLACLQEAECGL